MDTRLPTYDNFRIKHFTDRYAAAFPILHSAFYLPHSACGKITFPHTRQCYLATCRMWKIKCGTQNVESSCVMVSKMLYLEIVICQQWCVHGRA